MTVLSVWMADLIAILRAGDCQERRQRKEEDRNEDIAEGRPPALYRAD